MVKNKDVQGARDEQLELEALHRLDEECVHYQRIGNYLQAFDCMERALVLRRHFFGLESPEVAQACKALAEMCNLLSMGFLQQDNHSVALDLLKKAEILSQQHPAERATTLNNLACYYRRLGKLHAAMTCLKRALEIEKKLQNIRNAADTHLNICAVLSQLGKHTQALDHAQNALLTLQEEFFRTKESAYRTEAETEQSEASSPATLDRVSVMCIAYHNIGVEQEFLKDYQNSVLSYKKGVGLAEQYLGIDHQITTTIRNSYLAAKRTISTKIPAPKLQQSPLAESPKSTKSPGKAQPARLLQSPRFGPTGSPLRLPSPITKDQDVIPTPRSIIQEVLSKPSILPPIESPAKPGLSPTDAFFSPRYRFEDHMSVVVTQEETTMRIPDDQQETAEAEAPVVHEDDRPPSSVATTEVQETVVENETDVGEIQESSRPTEPSAQETPDTTHEYDGPNADGITMSADVPEQVEDYGPDGPHADGIAPTDDDQAPVEPDKEQRDGSVLAGDKPPADPKASGAEADRHELEEQGGQVVTESDQLDGPNAEWVAPTSDEKEGNDDYHESAAHDSQESIPQDQWMPLPTDESEGPGGSEPDHHESIEQENHQPDQLDGPQTEYTVPLTEEPEQNDHELMTTEPVVAVAVEQPTENDHTTSEEHAASVNDQYTDHTVPLDQEPLETHDHALDAMHYDQSAYEHQEMTTETHEWHDQTTSWEHQHHEWQEPAADYHHQWTYDAEQLVESHEPPPPEQEEPPEVVQL